MPTRKNSSANVTATPKLSPAAREMLTYIAGDRPPRLINLQVKFHRTWRNILKVLQKEGYVEISANDYIYPTATGRDALKKEL